MWALFSGGIVHLTILLALFSAQSTFVNSFFLWQTKAKQFKPQSSHNVSHEKSVFWELLFSSVRQNTSLMKKHSHLSCWCFRCSSLDYPCDFWMMFTETFRDCWVFFFLLLFSGILWEEPIKWPQANLKKASHWESFYLSTFLWSN